MYLPHKVGGPLPDRVEVIAGIWEDGETFGEAVWVKTLLDHRASLTSAYEQAIFMLQKGLNENWTRGQYLACYGSNKRVRKNLLQYFTENLSLLHKTKLPVSDTTH